MSALIFGVRSLPDGRLVVQSTIEGAAADLLLDTGALLSFGLDLRYAASRGFAIEHTYVREPEFARERGSVAGFVRVQSAEFFGKEMHSALIPVYDFFSDSKIGSEIAGVVGIDFFQNSVFAIDWRQRAVTVANSTDALSLGRQIGQRLRLSRVGRNVLPFTSDVQDIVLREERKPVLIADSGAACSALTIDYLNSKHKHRVRRWLYKRIYARHSSRRPVRWLFALPDETTVPARVRIVRSAAPYAQSAGVQQVDGLLGVEVLSQWGVVFDLVNAAMFLRPLS